MVSFKEYLSESCDCWKGYKRQSGTKPCAPGSCVKEEVNLDEAYTHELTISYDKNLQRARGKVRVNASSHEEAKEKALTTMAHEKNVKVHTSKSPDSSIEHHFKEELSAEDQFDLIEEFVEEISMANDVHADVIWEDFESVDDQELFEAAVDAKGYKSSTGGLTQKGVDAYNRKTGGNLKMAVTTPPSKLKAGSKAANRRKSFCARMSGVDGPMKDEKGRPTRKALALRKWNC